MQQIVVKKLDYKVGYHSEGTQEVWWVTTPAYIGKWVSEGLLESDVTTSRNQGFACGNHALHTVLDKTSPSA